MSKKKTGLLIALGAAIGAAAAGISYYLKYKSFNDDWTKISMITKTRKRPLGKQERELLPVTPPKSARILRWNPENARPGKKKMLRDRKTQNRPPKLLPRKKPLRP